MMVMFGDVALSPTEIWFHRAGIAERFAASARGRSPTQARR